MIPSFLETIKKGEMLAGTVLCTSYTQRPLSDLLVQDIEHPLMSSLRCWKSKVSKNRLDSCHNGADSIVHKADSNQIITYKCKNKSIRAIKEIYLGCPHGQ